MRKMVDFKKWAFTLCVTGALLILPDSFETLHASSNKLNLQEQALQPVTNSAVFATHNQVQQASDLRCASQNGTKAYACGPSSGIGPNPAINQVVYGMELQFISDVPCTSTSAPFPCTVNVDSQGPLGVFQNDGGSTPVTFGAGFHRIAADNASNGLIWRLEY